MRVRRAVAGSLALLMAVIAVPVVVAETGPVMTKITPYVGRTTLTWSSFNQLDVSGNRALGFTRLIGVSSGAMGIVVTGVDETVQGAATWISTDGGATWTEHLVPGATSLGQVVGHGGVLVAVNTAFWSSTDGVSWSRAMTGPHAVQWSVMAAGSKGFVAFARNGMSATTRVWLSDVGTSWTAAPFQPVVSGFCPTSIAAASSRLVAIGTDCRFPASPKALISTNAGRTWSSAPVPSGLRVSGEFVRAPSVSSVGSRFLVTGANSTQSATWVWSSSDGRSWHHTGSMPRPRDGFSVDTLVGIFKLGAGYLAMGNRDMPADSEVVVAWRSPDLVHWTRFSPPAIDCGLGAHGVAQATVVGSRLVAVGSEWSVATSCGETWLARVTS